MTFKLAFPAPVCGIIADYIIRTDDADVLRKRMLAMSHYRTFDTTYFVVHFKYKEIAQSINELRGFSLYSHIDVQPRIEFLRNFEFTIGPANGGVYKGVNKLRLSQMVVTSKREGASKCKMALQKTDRPQSRFDRLKAWLKGTPSSGELTVPLNITTAHWDQGGIYMDFAASQKLLEQ